MESSAFLIIRRLDEIMFWNEDRIKWYLLASEYTGYHDNMALEIKKVVPNDVNP